MKTPLFILSLTICLLLFLLLLLQLPQATCNTLVSKSCSSWCFVAAVGVVSIIVITYCFGKNKSRWHLLHSHTLRWKLKSQGITGPHPSLLYGNVPEMHKIQSFTKSSTISLDFIAHDYTSTLFPYFEHWRKLYGPVYTYSTGNKQHVYINHPELVKEMNQCITFGLGKPSYITKRLAPLLGNGILRSNGHFWSQQRKIVAPQFFMDKVKGMVGMMVESAEALVKKWELCIEAQGGVMTEIRVEEDLRNVSADVISRTCFGSSYIKGKQIFSKLRTLQKTLSTGSFLFALPTFGFLSTRQQKEIRGLEKEVESLIWDAVNKRQKECLEASSSSSSEKDLLQMILEEAINDDCVGKESSKQFIVDNCKNIYFAGHESTATAASWCLMLLALHPEWQARIRDETHHICHDNVIDSDSVSKMKTVTMVIQEVMRLYPPAAFVSREALEDTQIGQFTVPKGVCIWTLIPTLHRDPDIWGTDANEFNPERFSAGVSNACKVPQAYVPFGLGPRLCLGKNFAMVQLKVVISLIVSKFSFSLAPSYKHSPTYRMIVEPGHGVSILIQRSKEG